MLMGLDWVSTLYPPYSGIPDIRLSSRLRTVTVLLVPEKPEKEGASPPKADPDLEVAKPSPEAGKLSPEEQMARYEEELKETDWGHQPC